MVVICKAYGLRVTPEFSFYNIIHFLNYHLKPYKTHDTDKISFFMRAQLLFFKHSSVH